MHRRSTVTVLLLLAVVLLPVVQGKSLYDVLGVSESATTKQIRTAYKRLARKWSVVACDTSFQYHALLIPWQSVCYMLLPTGTLTRTQTIWRRQQPSSWRLALHMKLCQMTKREGMHRGSTLTTLSHSRTLPQQRVQSQATLWWL